MNPLDAFDTDIDTDFTEGSWVTETQSNNSIPCIVSTSSDRPYDEPSSRDTPAEPLGGARNNTGHSAPDQTVRSRSNQQSLTRVTERLRNQYESDGDIQELGRVSDEWKKSASCLALGTGVFLLTSVLFLLFSMTGNRYFVYAVGMLMLVWLFLRFGVAFYIYRDAKKLSSYSMKQRQRSYTTTRRGWTPSPFLWALFTLIMPPFAEFGPVVVYLLRRHWVTGIP